MTTDERLESLAQTVGPLAVTVGSLAEGATTLERTIEALGRQTTRNFEIVLDSIKRLENIALAHDSQIDALIQATEENRAQIAAMERQWQAYINTLPRHSALLPLPNQRSR